MMFKKCDNANCNVVKSCRILQNQSVHDFSTHQNHLDFVHGIFCQTYLKCTLIQRSFYIFQGSSNSSFSNPSNTLQELEIAVSTNNPTMSSSSDHLCESEGKISFWIIFLFFKNFRENVPSGYYFNTIILPVPLQAHTFWDVIINYYRTSSL